jgi:inosine/xanthosine triphosphate pyrophosphatase family protein
MKELIFGTTNPAKIAQIQGALKPLDISVIGLPEEAQSIIVEEDGTTAQENARKKALAYAEAIGRPVLSMDNALFLKSLPADKQPGIHVRRIHRVEGRPSDDQILTHYSQLIASLGETTDGRWEFALCCGYPNGSYEETTIVSPRVFVAKPSEKVVAGYPLESVQIDPNSGKYISEMSQEEQDTFWQQAIGKQLGLFVNGLRMGI